MGQVRYLANDAKELRLTSKKAFEVILMDMETGAAGSPRYVAVSIQAIFSAYSLSPVNGVVDFAACHAETKPEAQSISITNDGALPLHYRLSTDPTPVTSSEDLTDDADGLFSLEPFAVDRQQGTVASHTTECLCVTFLPRGIEIFSRSLFVHVSNAQKGQETIELKLRGESSVPMVDLAQPTAVFDDYPVVQQRTPNMHNVYCPAQNVFFFGRLNYRADDDQERVSFLLGEADEEQVARLFQESRTARLKFTNPGPLPVSLTFSLDSETEGGASAASAFEVEQRHLRIPGYGWRSTAVTFVPQSVNKIRKRFFACIDGNTDPVFSCFFEGEGVLPSGVLQVRFCMPRVQRLERTSFR